MTEPQEHNPRYRRDTANPLSTCIQSVSHDTQILLQADYVGYGELSGKLKAIIIQMLLRERGFLLCLGNRAQMSLKQR